MNCGCNQSFSSYGSPGPCGSSVPCGQFNCGEICAALYVQTAFNIPAFGSSAVVSVPKLNTLLIGSYFWNPTYGKFLITAFDSVGKTVTIFNDGTPGNAPVGTLIPACTMFILADSSVELNQYVSWTPTVTISAGLTIIGMPIFSLAIYKTTPVTVNNVQYREVEYQFFINIGFTGTTAITAQISSPVAWGIALPYLITGTGVYFNGSTSVYPALKRDNFNNNFSMEANFIASPTQQIQGIGKYIGVAI